MLLSTDDAVSVKHEGSFFTWETAVWQMMHFKSQRMFSVSVPFLKFFF